MTVPEVTVPEVTVREVTIPEVTIFASVPKGTVPEVTAPKVTVPEMTWHQIFDAKYNFLDAEQHAQMMHVRGHFVQSSLALAAGRDDQPDSTAADQPVFVALCSPLVTPHDKERVVTHNTMVYHTLHRLDMSYVEISHK